MIKAIIFDMDGVVVNSEPVHQRLEYEMFRELGLDIPEEVRNTFVGASAMDIWTTLIERYSLDKTPKELMDMSRGHYLEVLRDGRVPLVEGAMDLIHFLLDSGYKLMLASSATHRTIQEVLKWFRLEEIFKINIGGDQVSRSKPSPEIFLKVAEMGKVNPSECLVIEDARNGIVAAKQAGMYCIGFKSHYTGDQDLSMADAIVKKLGEINLQLIQQIQNNSLDKTGD